MPHFSSSLLHGIPQNFVSSLHYKPSSSSKSSNGSLQSKIETATLSLCASCFTEHWRSNGKPQHNFRRLIHYVLGVRWLLWNEPLQNLSTNKNCGVYTVLPIARFATLRNFTDHGVTHRVLHHHHFVQHFVLQLRTRIHLTEILAPPVSRVSTTAAHRPARLPCPKIQEQLLQKMTPSFFINEKIANMFSCSLDKIHNVDPAVCQTCTSNSDSNPRATQETNKQQPNHSCRDAFKNDVIFWGDKP